MKRRRSDVGEIVLRGEPLPVVQQREHDQRGRFTPEDTILLSPFSYPLPRRDRPTVHSFWGPLKAQNALLVRVSAVITAAAGAGRGGGFRLGGGG